MKDETINAKDALKAGGKVLRLQGGKSVVKIGGATLRSTGQYLSSFQVSTDDFTGSVPGKVKEAATNTGNILKKITNVVLHPLRNLIAMGKVILMGAVILLFLIIVSLLGQMSGTTSTSVFGANRIEDIQTLVQKINDYRNAAVTEGIYQAFQNDVDPNGNPYGYDSLTGQRSNNLQHAEIRYQFSCEQNELSTETGADFHLTVTDTASPDREMNTPSRDQNSTVQAANSFNNRNTDAPQQSTTQPEIVSQSVKQQKKQLDLLSLLLDFMPVVLVGAVLFAVRRKRRH